MTGLGWRAMFIVLGLAGLVVTVAWFAIYRDVGERELSPAEHAYREVEDATGVARKVTFGEWRLLFASRTTWGMIMGFFGTVYLTWIYTAWLPNYLEMQRHMSIRNSGFAAAVPYLAGVIGALWGGWLVDWLMRRGVSAVNSRKYPMTASLLGMAVCTVIAAYVPSNAAAIGFISVALFLGYVSSSTAWAMASIAAPANYTGSLGAIQNFGGYIGGALAPTVTGFIVQGTGSFVPALLVGAAVGVIGAIGYSAVILRPITAADLGEVQTAIAH